MGIGAAAVASLSLARGARRRRRPRSTVLVGPDVSHAGLDRAPPREGAEREVAFLSKPFDVDEPCRLIRSVLDHPDGDAPRDEANSCQPRHPA
jgi:hypothetical protein